MDLKETIEAVVKKVTSSDDMVSKFKADPEKVIEDLTGIDIPDEIADKVIAGVKAKIAGDKVSDLLEGAGKLFGDK